jgi:hypothetical protein
VPESLSEAELEKLSFELRCSTREHWTLGENLFPEKGPLYEPVSEDRFKVQRPATPTSNVPFTCPKCGKELTLQAQSRSYVWRRRWLWIAGTVAIYAALAALVVAIGVGKAVKPLWNDNELVFGAVLLVLLVPLALALRGPLSIEKDPGKHALRRVRPLT